MVVQLCGQRTLSGGFGVTMIFLHGGTLRPQSYKVVQIPWEMSYTLIQILMHFSHSS